MSLPPIQLDAAHLGLVNVSDIPAGSLEECNRLLQKNHDEYHMFFRDKAGHNHIVHSLLTVLALGANPQELQDRYDDGIPIQRALPPIDYALVDQLGDTATMLRMLGEITQYTTFLEFFRRRIAADGWKAVIQEYVFARTELADNILARMYEGAYHPLIHLGLGVEFQQPALVAEALAQAAAHDDSHIGTLFRSAENEASILYPSRNPKSMIQLIHEVRDNDTIRNAPQWSDFGNKMRDGIVGRAGEEMSRVAAQFQIDTKKDGEAELERRTAEMISTCAYFAGAAQREGRKRKIDFFYMHNVTSSIFLTVLARESWIPLQDRVRLVEWKARLDLAWYAVSGCAPLDEASITTYTRSSATTNGTAATTNGVKDNRGWAELFEAVRQEHDDGHAAKFIRALKNGEDVSREFAKEGSPWASYFPMKGDMWLRLARMCQDTTTQLPTDLKWVPFTGFEQPWKRPDLQNDE